ncbi:MAG: hypothetical protein JRN42_08300, partial [Nitrososphaerota archaeon]|nr:hypothetical protein [Nitrososphaerota archaeon]
MGRRRAIDWQAAFEELGLDGLKPAGGDSWLCVCPFHDDSDPSCQLFAGEERYYCHGCKRMGGFDEIFWEVGGIGPFAKERWLDRFRGGICEDRQGAYNAPARVVPERFLGEFGTNPGWLEARGIPGEVGGIYGVRYDARRREMVFPVRDAAGALRAVQRRHVEEKARQWTWPKGARLSGCFFGLREALEGPAYHMILVEGPCDCMYLRGQGVGNVVSTIGSSATKARLGALYDAGVRVAWCMF